MHVEIVIVTFTHCCQAPHVCYAKGPNYAQCMAPGTCREHWSEGEGSCEVASVDTQCAGQGGECTLSGCCVEPSNTCFLRNAHFGRCMRGCTPGVGSFADWSCQKHERFDESSLLANGHSGSAGGSSGGDGGTSFGTVALLLVLGLACGGGFAFFGLKMMSNQDGPRGRRAKFRDEPDTPGMEMGYPEE